MTQEVTRFTIVRVFFLYSTWFSNVVHKLERFIYYVDNT